MYFIIYISVIAFVLLVTTKKPAIAFSFMLCSFGYEQWLQAKDSYFIVNTSLVNIVSGVVVIYALVVKFIKDRKILCDYPLEGYLIILLYVYASASTLWSPVPEISAENLFTALPYVILMVILAPVLIHNKNDATESLLFVILFGGTVLVLLLFFTEWGYRTIVLASIRLSDQANPLAIANLAGYVMLSTILLNLKKKSMIWLIIRLTLVVISLAVAVKTGSRGQFLLMLFISLLLLFVSQPLNQIKRFVPMLITILFTLLVANWAMSEFIGSDTRWASDQMGADLGGRYEAATRLIERWYSSPINLLFGLGSSASYDKSIFGFYTHMVPLEIIGELGIVGFLIYVTILYYTFKNFRVSLKHSSGDNLKRGVLAALGGLVVFEFLLSFKQGSFLGSQIFFGLLVVLANYNKFVRSDGLPIDDTDSSNSAENEVSGVVISSVKLR